MSISRRSFLSWVGLAGFSVIMGESAEAVETSCFKGHPNSYGVLHDTVLCLGCRKCEEACNKVNELPAPEQLFTDLSILEKRRRTTTHSYTVVNMYSKKENGNFIYYKKQCNHCLEPACASACFVRALKKTREGAVVYDPTVCVGCRYCMIACPFEIPSYEYDNAFSPRIVKCTMCHDRVLQGKLPGCVDSCPAGALIFGKREELIKIARERIIRNPQIYLDHIYGEFEMGGTNWLYLSNVDFNNIGLRTDIGNSPAGEFTSPALSAVPMIVGLWPILLTGIYAISRRKEIIANEDKNRAIKQAIYNVEKEAEVKLKKMFRKAELDKKKAIENEVKKTLEEINKINSSHEDKE